MEVVILPLGKRPPRHQLRIRLLHHLLELLLLCEDMSLHLIDGRWDLDEVGEVEEAVYEEVADPDSP